MTLCLSTGTVFIFYWMRWKMQFPRPCRVQKKDAASAHNRWDENSSKYNGSVFIYRPTAYVCKCLLCATFVIYYCLYLSYGKNYFRKFSFVSLELCDIEKKNTNVDIQLKNKTRNLHSNKVSCRLHHLNSILYVQLRWLVGPRIT
jgi:hypothetical protein